MYNTWLVRIGEESVVFPTSIIALEEGTAI